MEIKVVIVVFLAVFAALYIASPSDGEINKCVEFTGWSEDRCIYELNH